MQVFSDVRPLRWPDETRWPRIDPVSRAIAYFRNMTVPAIRRSLHSELGELGAASILTSSSQPIGFQGTWTMGNDDPGVAVYFEIFGVEHVLACDSYRRPEDNLRAIGLAAESLMMLRKVGALQVYTCSLQALRTSQPKLGPTGPDPSARPWWVVLGFDTIPSRDLLEKAHRTMIRENHPDRGGDEERAKRINLAVEAARAYYDEA